MNGVSGTQTSDARIGSIGAAVSNISQCGGVGGASGKVVYILPEHVEVFAFRRRPITWLPCSEHVFFNLLTE